MQSLQDMLSSRTTLAIKRMGEVDRTSFQQACSLKFPDGDWEEISAKLCSSWEEYVKDPHWHPFKTVVFKGNLRVSIYIYICTITVTILKLTSLKHINQCSRYQVVLAILCNVTIIKSSHCLKLPTS